MGLAAVARRKDIAQQQRQQQQTSLKTVIFTNEGSKATSAAAGDYRLRGRGNAVNVAATAKALPVIAVMGNCRGDPRVALMKRSLAVQFRLSRFRASFCTSERMPIKPAPLPIDSSLPKMRNTMSLGTLATCSIG